MFRLITSNRQCSLVIFDSSALRLATCLLEADLEDRIDGLREALSNDPLLALWAVTQADHDGIQLRNLPIAARWLDDHAINLLTLENVLPHDQSEAAQQAWRSVVSTALRAARKARALTERDSTQAYWVALLGSCVTQLDQLAQLNGSSPLDAVTWQIPPRLRETLTDQLADPRNQAATSANHAIQTTASTDRNWLDEEECVELFRSQPIARQLVPNLLRQWQRLNRLESDFDQAVHHEKMAAMQQLAYGASHEINNPLANISARAQSLMHNESDLDRRRKLNVINQQAFRAYEMIADLMLFAKPPQLDRQSIRLAEFLCNLQAEVGSQEGVQCRVVGDTSNLKLQGDPVQLASAVKALCQNAVEAMGGAGEIILEITDCDTEVQLTVVDAGPGFDELARRHLFDPFYSGREAGRGMGFGLSKAWRIVDRHHGRITVASVPGHGSRFTITLPKNPSHAAI